MSFSWKTDVLSASRKVRLVVVAIVLGLSGVGSLFMNIGKAEELFDTRIERPSEIMRIFYNLDYEKYINDFGIYREALKHGIDPSPDMVDDYIKSQERFLENGKFSKNRFEQFIAVNKISKSDLVAFYKQDLSRQILRSIITGGKNEFETLLPKKLYNVVATCEKIVVNKNISSEKKKKYFSSQDEWQEFVKKFVKKREKSFFIEERRSGFLVKVHREKAKSKEELESKVRDELVKYFSSFKYINETRTKEFCEEAKRDLSEILIKTSKNFQSSDVKVEFLDKVFFDSQSSFLFSKKDFWSEKGEYLVFSYVTDIIPLQPKEVKKDFLFKKMFEQSISARENFILAQQISNDINCGNCSFEETVKKYEFTSFPFKVFLNDKTSGNEQKILLTREGKSIVFKDDDGSYVIIYVKKIELVEDKDSKENLIKEAFSVSNFISKILDYWVHHAKDREW